MDLNNSRSKLYLCLVAIKNKIDDAKKQQLKEIENKREQAIKEAKSISEFEFIELCSKEEKLELTNYVNSTPVITYVKKNTK